MENFKQGIRSLQILSDQAATVAHFLNETDCTNGFPLEIIRANEALYDMTLRICNEFRLYENEDAKAEIIWQREDPETPRDLEERQMMPMESRMHSAWFTVEIGCEVKKIKKASLVIAEIIEEQNPAKPLDDEIIEKLVLINSIAYINCQHLGLNMEY